MTAPDIYTFHRMRPNKSSQCYCCEIDDSPESLYYHFIEWFRMVYGTEITFLHCELELENGKHKYSHQWGKKQSVEAPHDRD